MIQLKNIELRYDSEIIFSDLNLHIQKGENAVLVGPSGCGKSSLFNILLAFVIPQKGSIYLNGKQLSASTFRQIRSQIAYLPQDLNLQFENVNDLFYEVFSLKNNLQNKPTKQITNETLEVLGLEPSILEKKLNEISGGQKQRILLASCILLRKPIVLLDEPSSALDVESVERVVNLLRKQSNSTILSSSHDHKWIKHCDRTITISK